MVLYSLFVHDIYVYTGLVCEELINNVKLSETRLAQQMVNNKITLITNFTSAHVNQLSFLPNNTHANGFELGISRPTCL